MTDAYVVLIHGFWSSRATWRAVAGRLSADPQLAGVSFEPFEYESPKRPSWFMVRTRIPDYEDIAQSLPAFLRERAPGTAPVVMVAHSQGGLILQRYLTWMLRSGRGQELARIRAVVLLACPNEGTKFLGPFRAVLGYRRHPQSSELEMLGERVADARKHILDHVIRTDQRDRWNCHIPFHVYSGRSDNVVHRRSAHSVFDNAETLPGDKSSILDPDLHGSLTVSTLKHHILQAIATSRPGAGAATAGPTSHGVTTGPRPRPSLLHSATHRYTE